MIRVFHLHVPGSAVLLLAADLSLAFIVISLGLNFSYASFSDIQDVVNVQLTQRVVFSSLIAFCLFLMGLHYRRYIADLRMTAVRVMAGHALAFMVFSTMFYLIPGMRIWLSALLPAMGLSLVGTYLIRLAYVRIADIHMFKRGVLVLGAGAQAAAIDALERSGLSGRFHCLGYIGSDDDNLLGDKVLPPRNRPLADLAQEVGASEIVVALRDRRSNLPVDELLSCRMHGIQVTQFATFMERETGRVELEDLSPSWLIFADGFSSALRFQRVLKRGFDIGSSLLLLGFTLPVSLLAACSIVACDGGPVFYRQERVGHHGQVFRLLKFRSMRVDAEKDGVARWATRADSRITPVGGFLRRTRIDEIPQIYNVLRGEMSFIGPRPERPAIVEQLRSEILFYGYRHAVKPGITGWAQINYSYGASLEDARQKLKLDLYYIKNYSIVLDLLILLQTVRVVLWAQGSR